LGGLTVTNDDDDEEEGEEDDDDDEDYISLFTKLGVINKDSMDSSQPTADEIREALQGSLSVGLGKAFRYDIRNEIKSKLSEKDMSYAATLMISNRGKFSINFLVWVLLDYMINDK
jgi:hypothetical protein